MYIENDSAENRLKRTLFVVEATSFEQFCLWEQHSNQSQSCRDRHPQTWEQMNPGWLINVGEIDKRPCCISVSWYKIDGQMIMFWYSCSQVTDSVAAEKWIIDHWDGKWDGGTRRAWTDAQNFHHCLEAIRDANKSFV